MKKLFVTLVVSLIALESIGQNSISGKIIEKDTGETLPYASVRIKGTTKGTTSNTDGFFSILNIPDFPITLEISYIGFSLLDLEITEAQAKELVLIEMEGMSEQLQEIVISATGFKVLDASGGISKATLSTKQLTMLPSLGETDIFRSLQLLPGVSATNENSSGLFVRGGTPDQNLVLLDGMTVYQVDHFYGFFSAFNPSAIKDVQLYKGAFPAKFGGRTSSVVELTGKTGAADGIHGGVGLNLLSFNGYLEVPIGKKFSLFTAGRRSFTDFLQSGLYESLTGNIAQGGSGIGQLSAEDLAAVNPISTFYDFNTKLTYRPTQKDLVAISIYLGEDDLDQSRIVDREIVPMRGPPVNIGINLDIEEISNWGNEGASGKWSRQWSPKLYSSVLVAGSRFFSRFNRDALLRINVPAADSTVFEGTFRTAERNEVTDLTFRADLEFQLNDQHKFEFGASSTRTEVNYSNVRDDTLTIIDSNQKANYGSLYLSDTWKPFEKLELNGGLRLSSYELNDGLLWEPRLSTSYQLIKNLKIKAAYGQHYQFVNRIINENITEGSREFWLLANDDLVDVSKAIHYVFGLSYEIEQWLFDAEAYYKDYTGLSEFSLRFRTGQEIDADNLFFKGTGVAKGIEFLIQKKAGNYTGWTSYTLGSVRNTFPELNNGNEFPALHDQLHEFKMVHTFEYENYRIGATYVFGSGKPFSEPAGNYTVELLDGQLLNFIGVGDKNGSRLPAYNRVDVSVHYVFDIGSKVKGDIGLSVFNLFNFVNTWYLQYDFNQDPPLVTEINYLGRTPNLSINIDF